MKEYILVSSGFILPANKWFNPLMNTDDYKDSLLKKEGTVELFVKLEGLIAKGGISTSPQATEAYLAYTNDQSFDNYMLLVDMLTDIVKEVGIVPLVRLQVNNPYLSPMGFRLCLELISEYKLTETYQEYAAVPTFFVMGQKADASELATREDRLNSVLKLHGSMSNVRILESLVREKEALAALFKYMLVDFNRGSSHV